MRASTLVGLGIALMLGVVAVGGIKYSGILNPKPLPVVEKKAEPIKVLAAEKNLFKGTVITFVDVRLRPASEAEEDYIKKHPDEFLPPDPQAAHLRTVARNVGAYELLKKKDFEELKLPPNIVDRLKKGMRAVDVELPKDRAEAGLLRVDEHVDVFLTSKILADSAGFPARTAIAPIARDLKIIVKRGIPFDNIMMPLPEDKPVSFILEANPYRAALIEYAKSRGILTLVATAGGAGGQLDDLNAEQERVTAFVQGKAAVNESDLVRIFHLPPIQPPVPPLRVEHYAGTDMKKVEILDPTNGKAMPVLGYHFMIPEGATIQAGAQPKAGNPPPNNIGVKAPPPAKKK